MLRSTAAGSACRTRAARTAATAPIVAAAGAAIVGHVVAVVAIFAGPIREAIPAGDHVARQPGPIRARPPRLDVTGGVAAVTAHGVAVVTIFIVAIGCASGSRHTTTTATATAAAARGIGNEVDEAVAAHGLAARFARYRTDPTALHRARRGAAIARRSVAVIALFMVVSPVGTSAGSAGATAGSA
jgi:hypothetical protein